MCLSEYWSFLKDSQLAAQGFGDKKSARLDLIFHKANQKCGLEDEDEHNPDRYVTGCCQSQFLRSLHCFLTDLPCLPPRLMAWCRELVPRQFVEALVRIAVLVYEKSIPPMRMSEALQRLLGENVVPFAIQSDTEAWRSLIASESVRPQACIHVLLMRARAVAF